MFNLYYALDTPHNVFSKEYADSMSDAMDSVPYSAEGWLARYLMGWGQ
jgi:hypothetical protein